MIGFTKKYLLIYNNNLMVKNDHVSNPTHTNFLSNPFQYLHENVLFLNNSKFFAGVVMIMLNIGSKFVTIQLSKSAEEYIKYTLSRQMLIFAMAWMGTRDIYTALGLTAVFVILSDHIFNEESAMCIIPHENRILHTLVDENEDGKISDIEINNAISILEKSKKKKQQDAQKSAYLKFSSLSTAPS